MPHSRKKLELTGRRFGKLTVLEPAENIGNRTAWRCRCDCGGEVAARKQAEEELHDSFLREFATAQAAADSKT